MPDNQMSDDEIRSYSITAKLEYGINRRKDKILNTARRIISNGHIYRVIGDTPEQDSDIFTILIDNHTVISFDLKRYSDEVEDIEISSVDEYIAEYNRIGESEGVPVLIRIGLELYNEEIAREGRSS